MDLSASPSIRRLFSMNKSTLGSPREPQRFCSRRDFSRVRKALLSRRDHVQKGRRQLVTQRVELRELRSKIERLEDDIVSAFELRSSQTDIQFKLSDRLDK